MFRLPTLLGLLACPGVARAESLPEADPPPPTASGRQSLLQGWSVQLTNRLETRYYRVDDLLPGFEDRRIHDYVEEVERLNVLASRGGFALGLQVDQVGLFANRYYLDEVLYRSYDLLDPLTRSPWEDAYAGLEKAWAKQSGAVGEVQVGDGYAAFGRGIALNLVRNTDIDVDTSIRGARGVLRAGNWEATAISGVTNPQQVMLDNRNLGIKPDLRHMVSGLRVERFGLGPVSIGVHGVAYRFTRSRDPDLSLVDSYTTPYTAPLDVLVGGVTAEGFGILGVDWVLEADLFDYRSGEFFPSGEAERGWAAYGSASAYPGPLVVLLEAKRYLDTERLNTWAGPDGYEVAVAPSLEYERVITEDSSAAVNSNDVAGVRLKVDWPLQAGSLVPYVAVGAFRDEELGGLHFNATPETIVHPVAGVQWAGTGPHLLANAGYRADIRDDDTGADRLVHVDMDLQVPAGKLGTVELNSSAMRFMWGENPHQQADFTDVVNSLALHHGEHWVFLLYQDFTDNPLVGSTGNVAEDLYGAAEVRFKPSSSVTAGLFYGAYKAGIRCAGGQCRTLPGFKGLRFSLSGSF